MPSRVISSVGLEHYLDRVGVTGSNPVSLTKTGLGRFFLCIKVCLQLGPHGAFDLTVRNQGVSFHAQKELNQCHYIFLAVNHDAF